MPAFVIRFGKFMVSSAICCQFAFRIAGSAAKLDPSESIIHRG